MLHSMNITPGVIPGLALTVGMFAIVILILLWFMGMFDENPKAKLMATAGALIMIVATAIFLFVTHGVTHTV